MKAMTLQTIIDAVNHNAQTLDLTQKRYANAAQTLNSLSSGAEAAWNSPAAAKYVTDGRELAATITHISNSFGDALEALRTLGRTATGLRTQLLGAEARLSDAQSAIATYESLLRSDASTHELQITDLQSRLERARNEAQNAFREIERIHELWARACRAAIDIIVACNESAASALKRSESWAPRIHPSVLVATAVSGFNDAVGFLGRSAYYAFRLMGLEKSAKAMESAVAYNKSK